MSSDNEAAQQIIRQVEQDRKDRQDRQLAVNIAIADQAKLSTKKIQDRAIIVLRDPSDADKQQAWDEWWRQTNWRKVRGTGQEVRYSFDTQRSKDYWNVFQYAAVRATGEPKLFCVVCETALGHPSEHSNTAMKVHVERNQKHLNAIS